MNSNSIRGNCFKASFDYVQDTDWTLVHGLCLGTGGNVDGLWFAHAWAQRGDWVWDHKIGVCEKAAFYKAGKNRYVKKYSRKRAARLIAKDQHYGPWDEHIYAVGSAAVEAIERELELQKRVQDE